MMKEITPEMIAVLERKMIQLHREDEGAVWSSDPDTYSAGHTRGRLDELLAIWDLLGIVSDNDKVNKILKEWHEE